MLRRELEELGKKDASKGSLVVRKHELMQKLMHRVNDVSRR